MKSLNKYFDDLKNTLFTIYQDGGWIDEGYTMKEFLNVTKDEMSDLFNDWINEWEGFNYEM